VDTCANEAIPQWGKRRLTTSVYLHFPISEMATSQAKNRHVVFLLFQSFGVFFKPTFNLMSVRFPQSELLPTISDGTVASS